VGTVVANITTHISDNYKFTTSSGDFLVQFFKPTAFAGFTKANQGGNEAEDSDADVTAGKNVLTTLVASQNDASLDAGLKPPEPTVAYDFSLAPSSNDDGPDGNIRTYTIDGVCRSARASLSSRQHGPVRSLQSIYRLDACSFRSGRFLCAHKS
jgi:hypothetical protein